MAESSAETGVPNLNLTAEEKRVYGHLFRQADTESVGVVTGEIAVKFFEKTRLDSRVLGEIWQIADKENRGFLTPAGFGVVLRLIGHAQAGREPTPELALQQGPIPRFEGIAPTPPPPPPAAAIPAQASGGRIPIPPLTPEKVAQYASLFERQPLQSGNMLPGDQAKSIFEKSGLPNEILGRIWMLADTEHRGALVQTEFVIAMHLLTSMKRGDLRALPTILPAPLYEAATRRGPIGGVIPRQQSPSTATPPVPAVPRQLTGQASLTQMRTGSPLARPPLAAQATGDWLVTSADKVRFDQLYEELDKTKKGYITGEEAVPFFSQSALPEDALAQIWDLADFRSEGRLTRDEFAVAMYLIRQQRTKREGTNPLPSTLPPNLIPPSLRSHARPPTATSAFEPPPRPQPPQPRPSALDDLFGLDDPQPQAQAQMQVPVTTGGGVSALNDPFATGMSPPAPSSPVRPSPAVSTFKPFMPASSFGMGLTAQGTGTSTGSGSGFSRSAPQPTSVDDDLLGDADPEMSKSLNNETTELANLSNQIGSLSKQMQDVQGQRTKTQTELNQATAQKKNFEQRLTQLRAMYEKEAQDVRSLETQLATSRNETKKLTSEMGMIDASYQDLQNQHRQVLTALQSDQQENASLKERIRTVNAEIAQLKPQIEKLKSEARQQKGLVAINKKQLATTEGEREKLKTEVEDLTKSNEELARQVSSGSSPVINQVASPALSTASANNPFFRRTGSTDIAATFVSPPPIRGFNDKSFDDVFGPSSQASTPPPAAAALFKPQNTGTSTGSVGSFATPGSTSPTVSRQATLATEPPAPPESRQISSSFLPFGDTNETLSSSRQVSPPLSRVSQGEGSQDSQITPGAQPIEAVATGHSLTSGSGSGSELAKAPSTASPTEAKSPASSSSQATFGGPLTDELKGPATNGGSDPFSVVDQAKAKEDFESAFASFKSAQAKPPSTSTVDTSKVFNTFNSEFPPISELERDDESDSESDHGGFDDDFAPASPPVTGAEKSSDPHPSSPTIPKSIPETSSVTGLGSPTAPDHSTSEKPASPSPSAPTNIHKISGSSVDDIFGSVDGPSAPVTSLPAPSQQSAPVSSAAAVTKGAFDDLDDDFEGLEDAKEGSADDDFANISRSGLDDFNAVFDSSPPPSQAKSESVTTGPFGVESSFDFGSLSTASVASGSTTAVGGPPGSSGGNAKPVASADSHDWDAIFSGLDETPTQSSPPLGSGNGDAKEPLAAGAPLRPTPPGRALTEDGANDDPILKNLTSMGYSRQDALNALEKYDYNLERAANYLASQS